MSEILPKRDFSYPVFSQKCVNYANLKIAKKQRNSSAFTTNTEFTSTSFWVKLPKLGNITQPRVILPLTTFDRIIENIYAIRNNKTRMFRPKCYPNQEKFTQAALGMLGTFSRSGKSMCTLEVVVRWGVQSSPLSPPPAGDYHHKLHIEPLHCKNLPP